MNKKLLITGGAGFIGGNFIIQQISKTQNTILNFDKLTYAGNLDTLKSIEDVGFKNTASIYSISDTAKFGGSIGWVQGSQLSELVINELQNMNPGEITKPIDIPGGLLIIKIDEKKMRELEINFDLELKKMIQYEKNKKLNQFSLIYYKKIKNSVEIYEN